MGKDAQAPIYKRKKKYGNKKNNIYIFQQIKENINFIPSVNTDKLLD